MEYRDYYQTLDIGRDATPEDIKRAYRKLARRYHPDVSKEADAEAHFKTVSEAYEVLKDPEKRSAYDQFGANWQAGQNFEPPPGWQSSYSFDPGSFQQHDAGGVFRGDGFSDFFESLFGQGRRSGSAFAGFGNAGGQAKPARNDIEATLTIGIRDAFEGRSRKITLALPTGPGGGTESKTLNVKIPRGILPGQRIRLEGQGHARGPRGSAGDLYLKVRYDQDPTFAIEGRDVLVHVRVMPWEAALGRSVTVPTLGGEVTLKLPVGVRSGQRLRLKGRGLAGSPPGDQYAIIEIQVPAPASAEVTALYERLEAASKAASQ